MDEKHWDNVVKPLMRKCLEHPDIDKTSKWYISQALFYVEHDLADGRAWKAAISISPVAGTLNSEAFYKDVYGDKHPEAVKLLRELGKEAKSLL